MASYSPAQFMALVQTLTATVQSLQHQLEWLQRQMFGTKSERLRVLEHAQQLALGEVLAPPPGTAAKEQVVAAHRRRERQRDAAVGEADGLPFFDDSRVPIETIEVRPPEFEAHPTALEAALRRRSAALSFAYSRCLDHTPRSYRLQRADEMGLGAALTHAATHRWRLLWWRRRRSQPSSIVQFSFAVDKIRYPVRGCLQRHEPVFARDVTFRLQGVTARDTQSIFRLFALHRECLSCPSS